MVRSARWQSKIIGSADSTGTEDLVHVDSPSRYLISSVTGTKVVQAEDLGRTGWARWETWVQGTTISTIVFNACRNAGSEVDAARAKIWFWRRLFLG